MILFALLAQVFRVAGGTVTYEAVARSAAGLIPHEIRGENRDVRGEVVLQDTTLVGTLYVPVARFSSGNLQRDRDVAELLAYRTHPYIVVTVKGSAFPVHSLLERKKDTVNLPVQLTLTVRDCTKLFTEVPAEVIRDTDTLEAHLALSTRFTDLGVEPPKVKGLGVFGGLVSRAEDRLKLSGRLRFVKEVETP